jgi:broad specificity phosphatase PhoE
MTGVRRVLLALFVLAFLVLAGVPDTASAQATPAGDKLVFIVRHAEKANATDPDPSLSEEGKARAIALADALRDARVTAIFVTARKRTSETAAPLAATSQVTPTIVSFGASTPEHVASVAAAVRSTSAAAVLVVGHSNTVPAIIAALGGPRMPDLCDAAYANLYILRLPARGAPTLVRTQFGAPDHADATSCAGMTMR